MADSVILCPPPAPLCVTPEITSPDAAYGEIGRPFEWYLQIQGGPATVTLTNLPLWASFDSQLNKITGIPDQAGVFGVDVLATGVGEGCGNDTQLLTITIVGALMIWGNWKAPPPAQFTEQDLLKVDEDWALNPGGYNIAEKNSRFGTYEISFPPPPDNWYQVFWIPDALLGKPPAPLINITVGGWPFLLNPAPNIPYQNLYVLGIPGKVFLSIAANNGGFTVSGGNPFTIS